MLAYSSLIRRRIYKYRTIAMRPSLTILICSTVSTSALQTSLPRYNRILSSRVPFSGRLFSSTDGSESSSYDVDSTDEDAEQSLAFSAVSTTSTLTPTSDNINGNTNINGKFNRYAPLLGKMNLSLETVKDLSNNRPISSNDVFCNRELRLDNIRAIGFDMDYTLAQYNQPAFDQLAFDGAKEKLVHSLGYPKEVLDFEYDHTYWLRGLIIDTQRGNFLKIDRHKYVR